MKLLDRLLLILIMTTIIHHQGMTMLILATDMARHGEIVELFKAYCEGSEDFDLSNKEHFDSV